MTFVGAFVTISQVKALDHLLGNGGEEIISVLARECGTNHTYMKQALERLQQIGLVEVKAFSTTGKVKLVRLARDGHGRDSQKVVLLRALWVELNKGES